MTTENTCEKLHSLTRRLEVFSFPFEVSRIPQNGIYLLFENGETGHGGGRIVRIGTHTGQDQLHSRLSQHFLKGNKDRSIFRKNVGRCLLNRSQDGYLEAWNYDMTTKAGRANTASGFDPLRQAEIEKEVSSFIRDHFKFVVVEVLEKADRLRIESGLISLVSRCQLCGPSKNWLGTSSPNNKIRASGLWQVNELYKMALNVDEIHRLFQTT